MTATIVLTVDAKGVKLLFVNAFAEIVSDFSALLVAFHKGRQFLERYRSNFFFDEGLSRAGFFLSGSSLGLVVGRNFHFGVVR